MYHWAAFDLAVCIILYLRDTITKRFTHTNLGVTYYTQQAPGQIIQPGMRNEQKHKSEGSFRHANVAFVSSGCVFLFRPTTEKLLTLQKITVKHCKLFKKKKILREKKCSTHNIKDIIAN